MNNYEKYERCFAEVVFKYAEKRFKDNLSFAQALWPEKTKENASTSIRAIKVANSRNKTQSIKISLAVQMAELLDIPLSSLMLEVETLMRTSTYNANEIKNKDVA